MNAFGLARIGREVELRSTASGESVASLSLAFTYGKKGQDGRRPTQWVDAALWGKRAESLAPYLLKGGLVSVSLGDVHIQTFRKADGTDGTKMAARVVDIELAGGGERQEPPAPRQQEPRRQPAAPAASSGFDDIDNDLPF